MRSCDVDPTSMPADANSNYEHWRDGELRRHVLHLLAGQPGAYQALVKKREAQLIPFIFARYWTVLAQAIDIAIVLIVPPKI